MSPRRNILTSININSSERDKSDISLKTSQSTTKNDDDCFLQFGIASSSKIELEDPPAKLAEHINAIMTLIIYHTYSRKHRSTAYRTRMPSDSIDDDIDRFDALYSCLIAQTKHSNDLNSNLRNRFLTLTDIDKLKEFEENEQFRIFEEKIVKLNRVSFIPNISSYQRRCPYYNLKKMKWIRDHLC